MDHLSAAGSSATRNLTTTEPSESLNRRKTVDFRFQRPHATSGSFFFNKPMRAMDSRRDFTSKKVFSGYFSELGEKANSALNKATDGAIETSRRTTRTDNQEPAPGTSMKPSYDPTKPWSRRRREFGASAQNDGLLTSLEGPRDGCASS